MMRRRRKEKDQPEEGVSINQPEGLSRCHYLNLGVSLVTTPTSSSVALKSMLRTDERHIIASCESSRHDEHHDFLTGVLKWTWETCVYLHRPVMGQLRLLLQLLLQVAVGLCLLGPDCSGSEAAVVACWVTLEETGALLGVHCSHDHTCVPGGRADG